MSCHAEFYVQPTLGLNVSNDNYANGCRALFNTGIFSSLCAGYTFGRYLSIEEEAFVCYNRFDSLDVEGYHLSGAGNMTNYGVITNVLYSFPVLEDQVSLYIGVGAGYDFATVAITLDPLRSYDGIYKFPEVRASGRGICTQARVGVEMEYNYRIKYSFEYNYLVGASKMSGHSICYKLKRTI
jgi:hypothetical protein